MNIQQAAKLPTIANNYLPAVEQRYENSKEKKHP
jgi:hypothetical protein